MNHKIDSEVIGHYVGEMAEEIAEHISGLAWEIVSDSTPIEPGETSDNPPIDPFEVDAVGQIILAQLSAFLAGRSMHQMTKRHAEWWASKNPLAQ